MATAYRPRFRREDVPAGECLCNYCIAKCCRYFALPIETPTTREEFDYMRWYLLHKGAAVFTEGDTWYLLVFADCKHLQPDNRCGVYETRPQVCREYSTDNCEFDDLYVYDRYFETPEQVVEFADALYPEDRDAIRGPRPALLPVLHG